VTVNATGTITGLNFGDHQQPADLRIIDDGDPAWVTAGPWTLGTNPGYQGDVHFSPAGNGSSTASWTFSVIPGQTYSVAATWTAAANRATNAPYTISSGGTTLGTATVNQKQAPSGFSDAGASWQSLGTFAATGNTLTVTLSNLANNYVIADAIRLQRGNNLSGQVYDDLNGNGAQDSGDQGLPGWTINLYASDGTTLIATTTSDAAGHYGFIVAAGSYVVSEVPQSGWSQTAPAGSTYAVTVSATGTVTGLNFGDHQQPAEQQIIDDGDPAWVTAGPWTLGTNPGYQGDVHFSPAGDGSSTASWTFSVIPGQKYSVAATWTTAANRATNAPYTISSGGTTLGTATVNQQQAPSGFSDAGASWQSLGTFTATGNTLTVTLSNLANGYVIADAILLQHVSSMSGKTSGQAAGALSGAGASGAGAQGLPGWTIDLYPPGGHTLASTATTSALSDDEFAAAPLTVTDSSGGDLGIHRGKRRSTDLRSDVGQASA
jgi:hypothetical protein